MSQAGMSSCSRRQVPAASGLPVRAVSLTSRLKMVTNTIRSSSRNELTSSSSNCRVTSSKDSAPAQTNPTKSKAVNATNNTVANAKQALWPSRSASHRVAPSKSGTFKSLKDDMVSSSGTESSGVYSDSDSLGTAIKPSLPNSLAASRLRPPSTTSSASRITTAVVKTASKFVRRPAATTPNVDQSVVAELRNENLQLKNQIERLKYESEEKYKHELATTLVEKEKQHQQEMEAKDAVWRSELEARLAEAKQAADGRLGEEKLRHAEELRKAEVSRNEERQTWQKRVDALVQQANEAVAEKERLEKNVKQEVENQVQAVIQRYNELKQETSSLQTVVEMRSQELRNVTHLLELARIAADEVPTLRERNLTLTNTIEDLQAQLGRKAAEERRLSSELAKLEAANKEASNRIRVLTSLRDQLEYRLQQRHQSPTHSVYYANDGDRASPVKVHQAPVMTSTPNETPKSSRKTFTYPPSGLSPVILENGLDGENNNVKVNNASRKSSGSSSTRRLSTDANHDTSSDADDVFNNSTSSAAAVAATQLLAAASTDPSTPTVRDVTKKNDSISYVLELGDEQPPMPPSPWQSRRPLGRSYSLRAPKHSKSH